MASRPLYKGRGRRGGMHVYPCAIYGKKYKGVGGDCTQEPDVRGRRRPGGVKKESFCPRGTIPKRCYRGEDFLRPEPRLP